MVLLESVERSSEDEVKVFSETLYSRLRGEGGCLDSDDVAPLSSEKGKLLNAPVQLATKLKIEGK